MILAALPRNGPVLVRKRKENGNEEIYWWHGVETTECPVGT
jgi:hypothetical protein